MSGMLAEEAVSTKRRMAIGSSFREGSGLEMGLSGLQMAQDIG